MSVLYIIQKRKLCSLIFIKSDHCICFRPNRPLTPTTDGLVNKGAHVPAFNDDLPGWFCTKNEDGKGECLTKSPWPLNTYHCIQGYFHLVLYPLFTPSNNINQFGICPKWLCFSEKKLDLKIAQFIKFTHGQWGQKGWNKTIGVWMHMYMSIAMNFVQDSVIKLWAN